MSSRLERLVAIGASTDAILLKVCPRCRKPSSRHDTVCAICERRAKKTQSILKSRDIQKRKDAGLDISEEEETFLEENEKLSLMDVTPEDIALLSEAPFKLPEEPVAVRPTLRNKLRFFMDRMRDKGRKVTTTYAASRLLKFDKSSDFVDFAIDHGVRPLVSLDGQQRFAAWNTSDIIALNKERKAEKGTRELVETEQGKMLTSLEAAVRLGITSAKEFVDFATEFGAKPAKAFGNTPEQMAWHTEDVDILHRIRELDMKAELAEEAIQRLERDIAVLQSKPMKWPDMQAYREKTKSLETVRRELAQLEAHIKKETSRLTAPRQPEQPEQKKPLWKWAPPQPKESSDRLARILAIG